MVTNLYALRKLAADLTGRKFGRLTAMARAEDFVSVSGHKATAWLCMCECGTTKRVRSHGLVSGNSRSCGCRRLEGLRSGGARYVKHGHSRGKKSRTYASWLSMIQRCTNPKCLSFKRYGGRGIAIHAPWFDFQSFLTDMGERPINTSLDRINNDGNYEPSNCRWATNEQQYRNTGRCHYLSLDGERKTISEWARARGIHKATIWHRLAKGWAVRRAITEPSARVRR